MTILFAHSPADLYGASRSLLRLAARLRSDGNRVVVVLPEQGRLGPELAKSGVAVELDATLAAIDRGALSIPGLIRLAGRIPASVARLARLIRRHGAEVVHTNTALILSPAIAAALCGVPHLWHIREFFTEFGGLWRIHQRVMARFSSRILAVSSAVAAQFDGPVRSQRVPVPRNGSPGAGLAGEKVVVLHNGFPRGEFEAVSRARVEDFRRRFGLGAGPVAGVVGRIKFRRKGQEVFVRAAAALKDRYPSAKFLLIGSPFPGNERHLEDLNRLIDKLGARDCVILTGDVEDVRAAYAVLDFTVLPASLPEPFGGVVIESMAMGKPVIGTRLGGTVEQIEDGVTGFLVRPNDPGELAAAMDRLLSDAELRARMGASARKRFLQHFEFEPFYARMIRIYEEEQRRAKGFSRESV